MDISQVVPLNVIRLTIVDMKADTLEPWHVRVTCTAVTQKKAGGEWEKTHN
jgi:hypothetical protein